MVVKFFPTDKELRITKFMWFTFENVISESDYAEHSDKILYSRFYFEYLFKEILFK